MVTICRYPLHSDRDRPSRSIPYPLSVRHYPRRFDGEVSEVVLYEGGVVDVLAARVVMRAP